MSMLEYAEELGYVIASSLSQRILAAIHLLSYPTPTLIAKTIKVSPSNVSTKLIELRKRGLVECITPQRRKGRIYALTKKGEYIVNTMNGNLKRILEEE